MSHPVRDQAQQFLDVWFEARRIVQTLNFNRFQQEGLSATQFILLTMLGDAGPTGAAQLARRLNVDVTTTMRTAESLIARGLLLKGADASDRRRSILSLTRRGAAVHRRMHAAFVERVIGALETMPARERDHLVSGLRAFVAASDAVADRSTGDRADSGARTRMSDVRAVDALAERIRDEVSGRRGIVEKRMFGGLAFLEGGHILVCASRDGSLLVRVASSDERDALLAKDASTRPMMMRSKMVARFLYVDAAAVATAAKLRAWIKRSAKALEAADV